MSRPFLLDLGDPDPDPVPNPAQDAAPLIETEDWLTFQARAGDQIPFLIDGLWPEGAFGFIASPPKKGKTWLALAQALALATGSDYLATFKVPEPRNVLYIALEGHRAALEARVAVLARGIGLDPDKQIERLRFSYKPRGINLADPDWADALLEAALRDEASLVIVDVLRSAARIKENDASEFAALAANLSPLAHESIAVALLHHFTKLSETSKERTPMERMSGSGAMGGALDVGIYITGSENDARRLRVEFDCRDVASPRPLSVELVGDGSGAYGTLTRDDKAWWTTTTHEVDEDEVKVPSEEIAAWIEANAGDDGVQRQHIASAFEISIKTVIRREPRLEQIGVEIVRKQGHPNVYRWRGIEEPDDAQQSLLEPPADPGHEGGHDPGQGVGHPPGHGVDTPPVSNPENGSRKPFAPDSDPGHGGTLDIGAVSRLEAPIQAVPDPGHPGLPTGETPPVSRVAPPEGASAPSKPKVDLTKSLLEGDE